jgi:hypothetical protein
LAKLADQPGWPIWQQYITEKRRAYYLNLASVLAHSPNPVDQRNLDYRRGYWDAARQLLAHPTRVLDELKLEGDEA